MLHGKCKTCQVPDSELSCIVAHLQAKMALLMPWWTLEAGPEPMKALAGLSGDAATISFLLNEQTSAANGRLPPGAISVKDARQVALEQGDVLLNSAAAGETDWNSIRPAPCRQVSECRPFSSGRFCLGSMTCRRRQE